MIDFNKNEIFIGNIIIPTFVNFQATDKNNKMKMPKYSECAIFIYPNEGTSIPHFHLFEKTDPKNPKTSCAIMIAENRYFSHGNYKGTLNHAQCLALNDWMNKLSSDLENTNWIRIKNEWNTYSSTQVTTIQPNYSFIKPYKG